MPMRAPSFPSNSMLEAMKKRLGPERFYIITTTPETRDKPRAQQRCHDVTVWISRLALICGFDRITEDNAYEVARRIATVEDKTGVCFLVDGRDNAEMIPAYITLEDVLNHIGYGSSEEPDEGLESLQGFEERFGPLKLPKVGKSAHDLVEESPWHLIA